MADLSRLIQGGMDLASAFGRGDSAYSRSMTDAARMEGLVLDAAKKREEMMARRGLGSAIQALGGSPDLATLFAAGVDPTKLSGYQGDMQEQGFRSDAASRATSGDWNGANAALMGVANGPQQLATVEGQNLLANRFLAGANGVTTTEQGRASMAADAARARASDASAASSYASAARTRQATGIDAAEFGLKRSGQWNPGGTSADAGSGLKLTEGQSKDIVYLRRGAAANKLLDTLAPNMTATGGQQGKLRGTADVALRGLPFIGNSPVVNGIVSSERQQAEQAGQEFLSAILRKDTGAAITGQEFDIYGRMYLPQPGDSDATLKQKAKARETALEAISAGLGPERSGMALAPNAAGAIFSGESTPQDVRRQSLLDKY